MRRKMTSIGAPGDPLPSDPQLMSMEAMIAEMANLTKQLAESKEETAEAKANTARAMGKTSSVARQLQSERNKERHSMPRGGAGGRPSDRTVVKRTDYDRGVAQGLARARSEGAGYGRFPSFEAYVSTHRFYIESENMVIDRCLWKDVAETLTIVIYDDPLGPENQDGNQVSFLLTVGGVTTVNEKSPFSPENVKITGDGASAPHGTNKTVYTLTPTEWKNVAAGQWYAEFTLIATVDSGRIGPAQLPLELGIQPANLETGVRFYEANPLHETSFPVKFMSENGRVSAIKAIVRAQSFLLAPDVARVKEGDREIIGYMTDTIAKAIRPKLEAEKKAEKKALTVALGLKGVVERVVTKGGGSSGGGWTEKVTLTPEMEAMVQAGVKKALEEEEVIAAEVQRQVAELGRGKAGQQGGSPQGGAGPSGDAPMDQ